MRNQRDKKQKVCNGNIQTPREARKKKGTQRESEREREWVELDNISNLVDQETESKSETGKHF